MYTEGTIVKIRIKKAVVTTYWYKNQIGEEYWAEVSNTNKEHLGRLPYEFKIINLRRDHYAYGQFVDMRDCDVLFELETK